MGRQAKKTEAEEVSEKVLVENESLEQEAPDTESVPEESEKEVEEVAEEEVTPDVDAILKLYPQYDQVWITDKMFVHPAGASEFLLKNAKLYKNKYYKQ